MCHSSVSWWTCHSNVSWWTCHSSVSWWTCHSNVSWWTCHSNVSWWTCVIAVWVDGFVSSAVWLMDMRHQQCNLTAGAEQRAGAGCVLHWAVCLRGLWGFPGKGTLLCRPLVFWVERYGNDQFPQLLVSGGRWVGGWGVWIHGNPWQYHSDWKHSSSNTTFRLV